MVSKEVKVDSRIIATVQAKLAITPAGPAEFSIAVKNEDSEPILMDMFSLDDLGIKVEPQIPRPITPGNTYSWGYRFDSSEIRRTLSYLLKVQLHGAHLPYSAGLAEIRVEVVK